MPETDICIITCSHFQHEIAALEGQSGIGSALHYDFYKGDCGSPTISRNEEIHRIIRRHDDCRKFLILGGSCLSQIELSSFSDVQCKVVQLEQCFYLVADRSVIDCYLRDKSYLMTSGWLGSWKAHVEQWGFTKTGVREFIGETTDKLVLFDTGVIDKADQLIEDFSEYVDCPFEIRPTGLGFLKLTIDNFIIEFQDEITLEAGNDQIRQLSKLKNTS